EGREGAPLGFTLANFGAWLAGRLNRSSALQPPIAFHVVGDGREMNLEFGLGQAHPAHRAEMITAFPGAEDLFDSCPDRLQRAIMRFKRFRLKPAMTLAQKLCDSAASFDCRLDRKRIIGLIAIDLARLVRDERPVESLPELTTRFVEQQLELFQNARWYAVLNIVEFLHTECLSETINQQPFEDQINKVLEREKSGYRFIVGKLAPITNEIEMRELEQAASQKNRFAPVAEHVRTSLDLYSKKPQPDYRNSIKESISAVESAANIIIGLNATLGDAIKLIDRRHSLHPSFKEGILKLYGYTSDEGGIRHSLTEVTNIDEADARYMLVSCSAFANYLISRYDKQS